MLAIRLARVGKKNKAQFKIVLQDHIIAPGGRHIEILGSYDPHSKLTTFKEERIKYWISQGAQASDTIHNLLISKGIISGKKRGVKIPAKKVEEVPAEAAKEEVKTEEVKVAEASKEEVKKEEKPAEEPKVEEKKEEVKVEEKPAE
jgi:small subunit ribosomal protein S16